MREIKAPEAPPKRIFLAGSIEMGNAENWQEIVARELSGITNFTIMNPRRDDWDNSWAQSITDPRFREQVEWEISAQEMADLIFMYFAPDTKAPITLLELGLFARSGKMIVCCPDGFWRKGNVEVVCATFNIPLYADLPTAITHLRLFIRARMFAGETMSQLNKRTTEWMSRHEDDLSAAEPGAHDLAAGGFPGVRSPAPPVDSNT